MAIAATTPSLTPLHEKKVVRDDPPNQLEMLEGLAQLLVSGTSGATELAEAMHREIMLRPFGLHTDSPWVQKLWSRGITSHIYRLIRSIMRHTGNTTAQVLRVANMLFGGHANKPLTKPFQFLVNVLNGVVGDHLIEQNNPLALPMVFYNREGHWYRGSVKGKVTIFLHGLAMSYLSWNPNTPDGMGEVLIKKDPDQTVLYLNYNTGRRISANGRSLSNLLQKMVDENPGITELDLVGHSMGGLVARSALFYGKQHNQSWVEKVKHLVTLGSPHHGAVLERLGFMLQSQIGKLPFAGVLARLGNLRSAGIIDLRHGSVRDDDWEDQKDRLGGDKDERKRAPLPKNVKTLLVAGTVEKQEGAESRTKDLVGDYLVTVASALGEHPNSDYNLKVPPENKRVFYNTNHMELQYSPAVTEVVTDFLLDKALPVQTYTDPAAIALP